MCRACLRLVVVLAASLLVGDARGEQLLFYDFNSASDPAVAVDSSGRGNNGDVIDPAVYTPDRGGRTGQPGDRAMDLGDFNNDAYVDVVPATDGALDSITENDQLTLALWVLGNDDQPRDQWAFFAGEGTARQFGSHIPWGNGNIYFDVAGCCGANTRIEKNEPNRSLYSGQWNHYAFVKNEGYTAIYQNGELWHDSGADEKDPIGVITEFYLGVGPVGDRRSYSGKIDDVGLWNTALSAAEIKALAEGAPPVQVAGAGVIGDQAVPTTLQNGVYGPVQSGASGWSLKLVDSDLTIDNHTTAELVLDDNEGEVSTGFLPALDDQVPYNVVDLAGGGGTFSVNHPYPNGVTNETMEDFAVRAEANVVIPAGTWTIGFASDDGGQLTVAGVTFDSYSDPPDSTEADQIRFEGNRGHGWTVGSFTLAAPLTTTITASMHERGGGDSFEIAVIAGEAIESASPAGGWELLGNGTLGWSVTTTGNKLLSADLTAALATARPFQFEVNGDTDLADRLVLENPDPSVYKTILDVDGAAFQIAPAGSLANGDSFDIVDADQIVGTPTIVPLVPGQVWSWIPSTGQIVFGAAIKGDHNANGSLDAGDLDLQAAQMVLNPVPPPAGYDLNADNKVNYNDRLFWLHDLRKTWVGDSDLNGEFTSADFVLAFQAGKYEVATATATWQQGDWDGNQLFTSADFVAAFADGGYEAGPRAAVSAVPEPGSIVLALVGLLGLAGLARRR